MMSVTTAAKIGVGVGITVATVRTFRVSNPISILGLAVTGQAIAWMPGFAALCLRSLKRENSLPLSADPLTPLPREVLTHIQGPLDTEKIEAGELGEATDPMGEAIDQFDDAETVTLEELREIRAFYPNFSRPQKKFSLDMSQTDITDEELGSIIAHFPNITEITGQDCQSLTDLGLEHLTGLANLTTLDLGKTLWITDDSLLLLASLENLTTLRLNMCIQVTDDGLPYLAGLANLKSLNLYGCNQITDEGLAQHLSRLAKNCRIILI